MESAGTESPLEEARELLEIALRDLESCKVLYERNTTRESSLLHLEQASEKILKAFIIGVLLSPLKLLIDLAEKLKVREKYSHVHIFLKRHVNMYINPKGLGHEFRGFSEDFLPSLYNEFCIGELPSYIKDVFNALLSIIKSNEERVIKHLMDQGLDSESAREVYNLVISLPSQLPIHDIRQRLCNKSATEGFGKALREIKEGQRPCLKDTNYMVTYVKETVENAYNQVLKTHGELLKMKVGELMEVRRLNQLLPREVLEMSIEQVLRNLVVGTVIFIAAIPFHICIARYYNVVRYEKGKVPKEDIEEVPNAVKTLEQLHEIVRNMLGLMETI